MSDNYSFSYEEDSGSRVHFNREVPDYDLITWPKIIYDVAKAIEVAFGYSIVHEITVKGFNLQDYVQDDFTSLKAPSKFDNDDETEDNLELFPETSAGLTD